VKHHYVRSGDDRQVDGGSNGARTWKGLEGVARSEETKNEEKKKRGHRLDGIFDTFEALLTIPKIRNLAVNLARRGLRISCPRTEPREREKERGREGGGRRWKGA